MNKREKVNHVLSTAQTCNHECHWPGCTEQVPPAMWGCKRHWFMLPKPIRDKIWQAYRIGQEEDGDISTAYADAVLEALQWVKERKLKSPIINI